MQQKNYIVHPYKFNLWLFLLTLIMVFGGLTSAYIVSKSFTPVAKIVHFVLPSILKANTLILILGSVTVQMAVVWAKRQDTQKVFYALLTTLVLGVLFLVGQFNAFSQLTSGGFPFVDETRTDNSVSFFYMFTGLHGGHILAGIIAVYVVMFKTKAGTIRPQNQIVTYEVLATFWHFLGLLWIYLYLFLLYNGE